MKRISYFFEYLIFLFFSKLIILMPLSWVRRIGAMVGEFVFKRLGFRRGVTLENLSYAFLNLNKKELEKIAVGAFRNVGITLFELLWIPRMNKELIKKTVHCENPELITNARSRGKGVIILTAHFGNWELCAQSIPATSGVSMLAVVRPLHNYLVDKEVIAIREMHGLRTVPMAKAVREFNKTLQEGGLIGLAGDQNAPKESVWIEWFGRKVPTHPGAAALALRNGSAILLGVTVRQPDWSYKIRFQEISHADLNGSTPQNVEELTRRHVKATEELIRAHPDHWMWMHRRWKHVPPSEVVENAQEVK